jgi:hypothetical protein
MTMGKIIQVRTVTGQEFPAFDSAGGLRVLNVRPTMPGAQRRSRYSDHAIVIPRSDWYETEGARPELPIKDQDGYSSCTGNGGARAMEQGYAIAGLKVPPLSASFAYAMVNGDVDRGANIGDILDILENMGLPTDATCPETLIFRSLIATHAPAATTECQRHRVGRSVNCPSWDEFFSSVLIYGNSPYAVQVEGRNDFDALDRHGVIPANRGPGDHCVCGTATRKLPDGRWAVRFDNSWTDQWGIKGRAYITEDVYNEVGYQDAYSIMSLRYNPELAGQPAPPTG